MPTRFDPFLNASRRLGVPDVNPLPVFGAQFGQETVLNSSPYVLSYHDLFQIYAEDKLRLALINSLEIKLKFASELGLIIDLVLIGGSFLRSNECPRDIDGLGFYHIKDYTNTDQAIRKFESGNKNINCDLKICPVDCGTAIIIKRAIFFANIFSYDKADKHLKFGTLLIDTSALMPDGDSL